MEIKTELLEEAGCRPGECGVMKEASQGKKYSSILVLLLSPLRGRLETSVGFSDMGVTGYQRQTVLVFVE